jgi:AcrR family transcriptional regulator
MAAKRDLRRRVLDAALELVSTGGIDELSIREVARRAGVTHQAPYHHFRDRAAILAAIAEEGFTRLRDYMIAAIEAAPLRADARFEACGLGYFQFASKHPAHFRIMFRSESHDPRRTEIQHAAGDAMRVLLQCVVSAQKAALAPPGDPWRLQRCPGLGRGGRHARKAVESSRAETPLSSIVMAVDHSTKIHEPIFSTNLSAAVVKAVSPVPSALAMNRFAPPAGSDPS